MQPGPPLGWLYVLACAVILAGGVVRLHKLGAQSFDTREVALIDGVDRLRFPETAQRGAGTDATPLPVPSIMTRSAMRWGYAESTLRFPSAMAGAATLPAL